MKFIKLLALSVLLGTPLGLFIGTTAPAHAQGVLGYAALPVAWADPTMCDPPGGIFDVDVTLGDTDPVTIAGFQTAINRWDGTKWYRLKIPPAASKSTLNGSTYNSDNSLVSLPIRTGVTKCLVIESTTPTQRGRMVCSGGLSGFGGTRNPGCDGHVGGGTTNDVAGMWTIRQDDNPAHTSNSAIFGGCDATGNCFNHIAIRDVEATILPGSSQSVAGSKTRRPIKLEGGFQIILENYYVHGWDPGDPGQPGIGSGNPAVDNATGACLNWNRSGLVTTANTDGTHGSVTWVSNVIAGKETSDQFGLDFSDGTHSPGYAQGQIEIPSGSGIKYLITAHDPGVSATVLTVLGQPGVQTGVAYALQNPATAYSTGCGDDLAQGVSFNVTNSVRQFGYIEKIHGYGVETHASGQGFSLGQDKENHNWEEAGSCGYFTGGAPVDTRANGQGPANDMEIRGNYFGRDLAYRTLSASSGGSPHPPFGCGPLDGNSAHDTCAFNWAIKNTLELKLGRRVLVRGNMLENNWSDGQDSSNPVISVRTCSGGATCGIFDAFGLPRTGIDNLRFEENWIRNSAQGMGLSTRSGSPGNGGGVSLPVQNVDILGNVWSNIGDANQWGNPGNDLVSWGGISNTFSCSMTRTSSVAHAACVPGSFSTSDHSVSVSSMTRSGNFTTAKLAGERHDPIVGANVTISGIAASGWNGVFAIDHAVTGAVPATWCAGGTRNHGDCSTNADCFGGGSCVASNGTFGDGVVYSNPGPDQTLCTSTSTCTSAGVGLTAPTWAYSITDIGPGDAVHVDTSTCPGGAHCDCTGGVDPASYGASIVTGPGAPVTLAVAPTLATGLDVYYPNTGTNDSSGTVCLLDNGSGYPRNSQFANNVVLTPQVLSINSKGQHVVWKHIANQFLGNIFTATGAEADVTCGNTNEGTVALQCWNTDVVTSGNVLQGRASGSWPVGSPLANSFPGATGCLGLTAVPGCVGFTKFMNGFAFPPICPLANAPYNCPLMALPWANNLTLSDLLLVPTSSYLGAGIDVVGMTQAMTALLYTCPTGADCGPHGPYPDFGGAPPPAQNHIVKGGRKFKGSLIKK